MYPVCSTSLHGTLWPSLIYTLAKIKKGVRLITQKLAIKVSPLVWRTTLCKQPRIEDYRWCYATINVVIMVGYFTLNVPYAPLQPWPLSRTPHARIILINSESIKVYILNTTNLLKIINMIHTVSRGKTKLRFYADFDHAKGASRKLL